MGAARSSLIVTVSLTVVVALLVGFPSRRPRGRFEYAGLVVAPTLVGERNVKDPEFFRYPNHSLFRDSDGRYYVVVTADRYPAILTTKDLLHYELFAKLNLSGKVAPFVLYDPQGKDFYLFYSDWGNTISSDIEYARLGLAIAHSERGAVPKLFTDLGYVTVDGSPLIDPSAGWDPYVVMIGGHYLMIFSAASHGVHLATADGIGTAWRYIGMVTDDRRENPALFYTDRWYLLLGIYDGSGYDLYSSTDFLRWKLARRMWFLDRSHHVLPAGSTCAFVNGTLYHLYQVPLSNDYVSGPFSLHLAKLRLS